MKTIVLHAAQILGLAGLGLLIGGVPALAQGLSPGPPVAAPASVSGMPPPLGSPPLRSAAPLAGRELTGAAGEGKVSSAGPQTPEPDPVTSCGNRFYALFLATLDALAFMMRRRHVI